MTSSDRSLPDLGDAGFSILEVVVALVILLTVLVSVSSLLVTAFKVGANSRFRQAATEIATSTLDSQVQTGATTLLGEVGDTALPSVTSSGQTYLAELEVNPYTPGSSGCVSPTGSSAEMLKVTVWVTWANEPSGATWWIAGSSSSTGLLVEETTLVALPATDFDPTLGTIFVSILNASGSAVQSVLVTATNGTTSLTATTTASGCALFANITPGNWWVTGSKSGYIDAADDWNTTTNSAATLAYGSQATPVQVVADQTINVSWAYDQGATVSPSYSLTTANSWLPINIHSLPLTFYTSPTNTGLSPNAYVSTAPAEAYPYPAVSPAPSYYVVAGSCGSESAPGAGTSYVNAASDGQPVTLTPGSQASPVFALTPVKLAVLHGATVVSGATVTASVASTDTNCGSGSLAMPVLQLGQTCSGVSACAVNAAYRRGHDKYPGAILVSACTSGCSTSTTLSNLSSATYGSPVTFTATVACTAGGGCASPSTPNSGSVTFKSGATTLGSSSVNSSGVATFSTSSLAVGSSSITAVYGASGKWNGSTSGAKTQTITAVGTTTTLTSTPNPTSWGISATLTATVAAVSPSTATPGGTVNFTSGGTVISGCGGVSLSSGQASCTFSGTSGGTYNLAAVYAPSPANFTASTSATLVQTISASSTTTTLTSSSYLNTSSVGSSVMFTATVTAASGGPAGGTITFKAGGSAIAACPTPVTLVGGSASCTTSALAAGTLAMTAVFTPTISADFATSTGAMTQYVYASSASIVSGLPYGVWVISVTDTNGTVAAAATLTITPSGVFLNGGTTPVATGTEIVLSD